VIAQRTFFQVEYMTGYPLEPIATMVFRSLVCADVTIVQRPLAFRRR